MKNLLTTLCLTSAVLLSACQTTSDYSASHYLRDLYRVEAVVGLDEEFRCSTGHVVKNPKFSPNQMKVLKGSIGEIKELYGNKEIEKAQDILHTILDNLNIHDWYVPPNIGKNQIDPTDNFYKGCS